MPQNWGKSLKNEEEISRRWVKKINKFGQNISPEIVVLIFLPANPNCGDWKEECLKAHNDYRAKHQGTEDLKWSDSLAWEAQAWANQIASTGKPAHCPAKKRAGQGENLACAKGIHRDFNFCQENVFC